MKDVDKRPHYESKTSYININLR